MEKIEALIEADIIDVTYAKSNMQISDGIVYLHSLSDPRHYTTVDVMIDAKLHNFDVNNAKVLYLKIWLIMVLLHTGYIKISTVFRAMCRV
ncbi:hypothetical protein P4S72_28595 [Vibrio sp. PP-XX7]